MIVVDTGPLVAALYADDADHERCLHLLESHQDASVVAVAERLQVAEVAALDLRHLTVVRPRTCHR